MTHGDERPAMATEDVPAPAPWTHPGDRSGAAGFPPEDYVVEVADVFRGTLELLLAQVRENALDVTRVPLARIVTQFLADLRAADEINLLQAGEVLALTATLARWKIHALLPALPEDLQPVDDEDLDLDPREELARRLAEYRLFRGVADELGGREETRRLYYERGGDGEPEAVPPPLELDLVGLLASFRKILREAEGPKVWEIDTETMSLEEAIESVQRDLAAQGRVPFARIFRPGASRFEVIVVFIALLELIRQRRVSLGKDDDGEPLLVHVPEGEARGAAGPREAEA